MEVSMLFGLRRRWSISLS